MAKKQDFSIETVKKYYFWVVVPLGLIVAIFVTVVAVAKIDADFKARTAALESTKRSTEAVRNEKNHPNQGTIDEIKGLTTELNTGVEGAWTILARDQQAQNLWPGDPRGLSHLAEVRVLGPSHLAEVQRAKFGSELTVNFREAYLNFVDDYLPYLETFVERRRLQIKNGDKWEELPRDYSPRSSGGADGGPMGRGLDLGLSAGSGNMSDGGILAPEAILPRGPDGEEIYQRVGIVDWPDPEINYVTTHWQSLPKSVDVWYAQEDLWVYTSLLWVIKETNAGATGPHNAVVKRIENLSIGKSASMDLAARSALRVGGDRFGDGTDGYGAGGSGFGDAGGAGSYPGASSGAMSYGPDMGMGMGMGMGSGSGGIDIVPQTEADAETFITHYRYVDDKAQPLAASANPPFVEFKRMPICLRLIVDQRRIPEILVNCANSAMPIEVLWVRINPGEAQPFEITAYVASGEVRGEATGVGQPARPRTGAGTGNSGRGTPGMGAGGAFGMGASGAPGMGPGGTGMGASAGMGGGDATSLQLGGALSIYGTEAVPIEIYGCISIFNSVDDSILRGAAETKQ